MLWSRFLALQLWHLKSARPAQKSQTFKGINGFWCWKTQENKAINWATPVLFALCQRYGYAFQSDLTNLAIGSVAIGIRPSHKFSLGLGLHVYRQFKKSTVGPNARFLGVTTGNSAFLGTEINLVGAWRPNQKNKTEFSVRHFTPGTAFVDQTSATRAYMRMTVSF